MPVESKEGKEFRSSVKDEVKKKPVEVLTWVASQFFDESVKYVDWARKVPMYVSSSMLVIGTLASKASFPSSPTATTALKIGLSLGLFVLAAYGIYQLRLCHKNVILNRRRLSYCREALLLFDEDAYVTGERIVPTGWRWDPNMPEAKVGETKKEKKERVKNEKKLTKKNNKNMGGDVVILYIYYAVVIFSFFLSVALLWYLQAAPAPLGT